MYKIFFVIPFVINLAQAKAEDKIPTLRAMPPDPIYVSQGFRLGTILKMNSKGLFFWRYRYEGKLMLGVNTNSGDMYDNNCISSLYKTYREEEEKEGKKVDPESEDLGNLPDEERIECLIGYNPVSFSFFDDYYYNKFKKFSDGQVVIFYKVPLLAPQDILTDTKRFLRGIWMVNPSLPIEKSKIVESDILSSEIFTPQKAIVDGRVVGASVENIVRQTYEIIVQLGTAANNFIRLSVSSNEMFDYLVRSMFAGKVLRMEYVKVIGIFRPLSHLRGYDTDFRILRAKVIN